ncbi:MAG: sugar ABC transporter permease [Halanaerobiales bacterium]|nr:sugar ABC transporter permease [Halanaerobiales bacterium]
MIISKKNRVFYFIIFLLPALLLYCTFFVFPLLQGIRFSFTDWNGIVPEIPFSLSKEQFENDVIKQLQAQEEVEFLRNYYQLDHSGQYYRLQNWIEENGTNRKLNDRERKKIKRVLKSVGISPINYIGLANFREMFADQRFIPRFERKYLFNEFDPLPLTLTVEEFRNNLLNHIENQDDQAFLLSNYIYNESKAAYQLIEQELSFAEDERLRLLLSENLYAQRLELGVIGFTLFFTVFNVFFSNILALLLALVLDQKMRMRNILRSMFFLPNVISLVIVAYIWSFMFRLIFPRITGISIWLGSPELAKYAVLLVTIWQGCGYLMIIYLAGLQTIPPELIEAAEVDGASWLQKLFRIKLPLLVPSFTICLFYSLAHSLKHFDGIFALTGGGPGYATTNIVIDIYKNAFLQNRYGYATAKAILLCLIIIIITGTQLYLMKKKEVEL